MASGEPQGVPGQVRRPADRPRTGPYLRLGAHQIKRRKLTLRTKARVFNKLLNLKPASLLLIK